MPAISRDLAKRSAAQAAASLVEDGMVVGLGSGTTAAFLVRALARRAREEGLRVTGVATSGRTESLARRLGIPLTDLTGELRLDLAIDGADEIEIGSLSLIKGLGGALLREKIVAAAAARFVVIADDGKPVTRLGEHAPVPVEVARFGHEATARRLADLGGAPALRRGTEGAPFVTDNGNYVYDCTGFAPIADAASLEARLAAIVGVVASGLFVGLASAAYVGDDSGAVRILRPGS
jgi:ribose 5-phosphate isomerase A